MERAPDVTYTPAVLAGGEFEQPPVDLMALYNDGRILNMMGVKATLDQLAKLCPKNIDEMSLEQRNSFLVMSFNASGQEIEPVHQELFDSILDERKIEHRYSIKSFEEPRSELIGERPPQTILLSEHKATKVDIFNVKERQTPTAESVIAIAPLEVTLTQPSYEYELRTNRVTLTNTIQTDIIHIEIAPKPVEASNSSKTIELAPAAPSEPAAPAATTPIHIEQQSLEVAPTLSLPSPEPAAQVPMIKLEQLPEDDYKQAYIAEILPPEDAVVVARFVTPAEMVDQLPTLREALPDHPVQPIDFEELYNEPDRANGHEPTERLSLIERFEDFISEQVNTDDTFEADRSLALVIEIKEITQLLAEQMLEPVPGQDIAIMPEAEQELVVKRLVETCRALLESLDMPADDETIKRVIFTFMQEEQLRLVAERIFVQIDLSRVGTHEVKTEDWFARFGQMLVRIQRADHNYIGRIALTASTARAWRPAQPV